MRDDEPRPNRIPKMPQLEGQALELYRQHFGQQRYQKYNTCRKDGLHQASELPKACVHQPRHDVESYFWMLALYLLQAVPEGVTAVDYNLERYQEEMRTIMHLAARADAGGRSRSTFLTGDELFYQRRLHPGLAMLAPLIAELAHQTQPEWEFLSEPLPADHLHEAFHRILLKWIVKLKETPLPVQIAEKRPVPVPPQCDSLSIANSNTSSFVAVGSCQSMQFKRQKTDS